ncbi:hypothetical protein CJU89_4407 [Yarrowia sp. B02]|nr:hypothetical protein CJU89_4407 [Yarrowia sp. B02]
MTRCLRESKIDYLQKAALQTASELEQVSRGLHEICKGAKKTVETFISRDTPDRRSVPPFFLHEVSSQKLIRLSTRLEVIEKAFKLIESGELFREDSDLLEYTEEEVTKDVESFLVTMFEEKTGSVSAFTQTEVTTKSMGTQTDFEPSFENSSVDSVMSDKLETEESEESLSDVVEDKTKQMSRSTQTLQSSDSESEFSKEYISTRAFFRNRRVSSALRNSRAKSILFTAVNEIKMGLADSDDEMECLNEVDLGQVSPVRASAPSPVLVPVCDTLSGKCPELPQPRKTLKRYREKETVTMDNVVVLDPPEEAEPAPSPKKQRIDSEAESEFESKSESESESRTESDTGEDEPSSESGQSRTQDDSEDSEQSNGSNAVSEEQSQSVSDVSRSDDTSKSEDVSMCQDESQDMTQSQIGPKSTYKATSRLQNTTNTTNTIELSSSAVASTPKMLKTPAAPRKKFRRLNAFETPGRVAKFEIRTPTTFAGRIGKSFERIIGGRDGNDAEDEFDVTGAISEDELSEHGPNDHISPVKPIVLARHLSINTNSSTRTSMSRASISTCNTTIRPDDVKPDTLVIEQTIKQEELDLNVFPRHNKDRNAPRVVDASFEDPLELGSEIGSFTEHDSELSLSSEIGDPSFFPGKPLDVELPKKARQRVRKGKAKTKSEDTR